jgi:hypothetical protein
VKGYPKTDDDKNCDFNGKLKTSFIWSYDVRPVGNQFIVFISVFCNCVTLLVSQLCDESSSLAWHVMGKPVICRNIYDKDCDPWSWLLYEMYHMWSNHFNMVLNSSLIKFLKCSNCTHLYFHAFFFSKKCKQWTDDGKSVSVRPNVSLQNLHNERRWYVVKVFWVYAKISPDRTAIV